MKTVSKGFKDESCMVNILNILGQTLHVMSNINISVLVSILLVNNSDHRLMKQCYTYSILPQYIFSLFGYIIFTCSIALHNTTASRDILTVYQM